MIIVNTNTNIVHENANFIQAGIITGADPKTISKWLKIADMKKYKQFILYFKVIKLKRGMMT